MIVIKFKCKGRSSIAFLKLVHSEHDDDDDSTKHTKEITKMIHQATMDYNITQSSDQSFEKGTSCQLVTVSSDHPCLHEKRIPEEPQIEQDPKETMYTVPLYTGWIHDGTHGVEGVW